MGNIESKWINDYICDALRDFVPFIQFKNMKKTHRGVLLLVKLQAKGRDFSESNTPPLVFFTFFNLYKRYQIAQSIPYMKASIVSRFIHYLFQYQCAKLRFHSEPFQTWMEAFAKIAHSRKALSFFIKSFILDVWQVLEYVSKPFKAPQRSENKCEGFSGGIERD